jgi:DNA-binding NtrC family response regulator
MNTHQPGHAADSASAGSDRNTVLVIDDNGTWRSALAAWLEHEGFRVAGFSRAEWAASAVDTHGADIVILDVHAPGLDGLELLGRVRRRCPSLPVVVTTSFGGPQIAAVARRRGAACYLEKPFRLSELTTALRRLLWARGHSATTAGR